MEDFDPFAPDFVADPHAVYRAMRERDRATFSRLDDAWLITRYDDVVAVLHDPATFSSDDRRARAPRDGSRENRRGTVIGSDPPDHTRLRRALARGFVPRRIAALRPRIEALVDELIDRGLRDGQLEIMEQLAVPLPLRITAEMLGLDPGDHVTLRGWAESEMTMILPGTSAEEARRLVDASAELFGRLRASIARARVQRRSDDWIGHLVGATDDEGRLTDDELLATAGLLVRAGSHTVTHLIGNGVLALLRNRPQLEALRARPALWPSALDELLRYAGPLHAQARIVTRPVSLHGVELAAGERLLVVLAAANRDPHKFPDPDALQLDRGESEHLGLGSGIHYCVGALLGRVEAQVAIERLLARMPLLQRADPLEEPEWALTWTIRGLRRLQVRGAPSGAPRQV